MPQNRLGVSDDMFNFGGGGGLSSGSSSAAAPAAAAAAVAEPVKVKEFFDVKLTVVDQKAKIKIIKEVRAITGLGLKEVFTLLICFFHFYYFK
jgi:large subunit ribosomal protein L7/L12